MSSYQKRSKFYRKLLKGCLELFVLTILNEKNMGGYDLMGYCYERYSVLLTSGTIYPILNKMKKEELIVPSADTSLRGISYTLTQAGRIRLAEDVKDFDSFVDDTTLIIEFQRRNIKLTR